MKSLAAVCTRSREDFHVFKRELTESSSVRSAANTTNCRFRSRNLIPQAFDIYTVRRYLSRHEGAS
jgi:hypothetical protein